MIFQSRKRPLSAWLLVLESGLVCDLIMILYIDVHCDGSET